MKRNIVALVISLVSSHSLAAGLTVHDPLSWIEAKIMSVEQALTKRQMIIANHKYAVMIRKQLDLIDKAKKRNNQLENLKRSLSGKNAYGRFLWGPFEMLDPAKTPATFEQLYWMTRDVGKNPEVATDGYGKEARAYMERNQFISPVTSNYPDSAINKDFERQKTNSIMLGVNSESTYEAAARNYANINAFQHEIDETNTVKEALDLNNRILTEIALVQTQLLRLNSLESKVSAEREQRDYNQRAKSRIRHSIDVGW